MVKILLLSDTHSYLDERMLIYINQADEVWHAGDIGAADVIETIKKLKPLRAVYGNIDSRALYNELPKVAYFKVENYWVLMTHIGGYPNRYA
ncbi:MAG: metallophosphoesterase family protein, partial [Zetaproteobacteria bacterium]|nr:metallophosphoesterase family protein [Flavobacteriales bacterium]